MTDLSLQKALALDLCTVLLCGAVALRCASSLLHPSTVMLGAHAYIVTLRLSQLTRGFKPMSYSFSWPIGENEIVRASIASDAALLAMTLGWLAVCSWGHRGQHAPLEPRIRLSDRRLQIFSAAALCLAIMGLAILGPHAQREVAGNYSATNSGYLLATTGWVGWSFCLLHFRYGFRWPLLSMTAMSLIGVMLLSTFRGAVIIPCVFLLFTWLARRQESRPPWGLVPAVVGLWLVWLPMKPIVYAIQSGMSPADAISVGIYRAFTNLGQDNGSGIDFQFLDMVSSTMTLVDMHHSYFYGTSISPLFVSPIPRQLWAGKPELNQYQQDLDIPSRAMSKLHMTAGLVGEAYADFGYLGVFIIPFAISVAFSAAYRRLAGTSLLTPGSMLYVLYLSTYMQLYRDGMISAVWFPFVHCAPIGWAAVSHWIWRPHSQHATASTCIPIFQQAPVRLMMDVVKG
jgi:hypothetical protein